MKKIFKNYLIKLFSLLVISFVFLVVFFVRHEKRYHISMPFQLSSDDQPIIKLNIEKNLYPVEINIGSKRPFVLNNSVLENLSNKRFKAKEKEWDEKGDLYNFSSYIIPELQIGDMNFENITVFDERSDDKALEINEVIEENYPVGMTGCFLREYNLLFDFKDKIFCISNNKKELKKLGYDFKDFIKIPFEMCDYGIKINSYSDLGIKTLLLTTGFSVNMIRPSSFAEKIYDKEIDGYKVFTSTKFFLDYVKVTQPPKFFLFDLDKRVPVDGVLGMEFLSKHTFYIDFKNRNIYFQK